MFGAMRSVCLLMVLWLAGSSLVQGGGTLGDAIRKKAAAPAAAAEVLASVQNGQMSCELLKADLTNVLRLPDCAFGAETHMAPEGYVLLVLQGRVRNTGRDSVIFQIPDFVSASGKHYEEVESVHFTDAKSDMMGMKLNPGQQHAFVCFYALPVDEILGGQLRFEKDLFYLGDDDSTLMPLPLDENVSIKDRWELPGVTDL